MAKKYSTIPEYALNAICPYYAMFPMEFPYKILRNAEKGASVLDVFCGRGTTNYAAQVLGLKCYGIDTSKVAVAIAKSKLAQSSLEDVLSLASNILQEEKEILVPNSRFWKWAFHADTLVQICKLREGLRKRRSSSDAVTLRALILGCLHGPRTIDRKNPSYLSNQMPRTYAPKPNYAIKFWINNNLRPRKIDVLKVIAKKGQRALAYPSFTNNKPRQVVEGDSRYSASFSHIKGKVDYIITSPPYYGLQTYVEDQWIRNWFLGGPDYVPYKNNQHIPQSSQDKFSYELSKVWSSASRVSKKSAKLVVRFGTVGSHRVDPIEIFEDSLNKSGESWQVYYTRHVGSAGQGKRQALHMGTESSAIDEYDYFCRK